MILCFQRKMLVFYTTLLFNCVLVSSIADASDNNFNFFFQDALTIKKFRYFTRYSEEKCLQNGMFFLISRFHSLTHTHTSLSLLYFQALLFSTFVRRSSPEPPTVSAMFSSSADGKQFHLRANSVPSFQPTPLQSHFHSSSTSAGC